MTDFLFVFFDPPTLTKGVMGSFGRRDAAAPGRGNPPYSADIRRKSAGQMRTIRERCGRGPAVDSGKQREMTTAWSSRT
jgi:hypothetical protein